MSRGLFSILWNKSLRGNLIYNGGSIDKRDYDKVFAGQGAGPLKTFFLHPLIVITILTFYGYMCWKV